jgi:glycosyltransferase involved in cell wall biosynthesis
MRIAIDARLNAYRVGGIPQYTRRLAAALAEAAPADTLVTLQHREQRAPLVAAENAERMTLITPPHHRFERLSLPAELLRVRAGVLHFPDFIAPPLCPAPAVVTIHDLAFLRFPEILDDAARAYYGQVGASARRAAAVIAVSEATRRDIVELLGLPPERVDVVYEAAAPGLAPPAPAEDGEEAPELGGARLTPGSFALFVGTVEPRKNLPLLLRALKTCVDRRQDRRYRLVVAGAAGWRDGPIYEALRDLRLGDAVVMAGKVTDAELRWLYGACRMYLNPSRYEGFGLPLLEAMACGAACLAASGSSLPEIGGEAAAYLPPDDEGAWADAIEALWEDGERRALLGRLGVARAAQFSWARAARETLAIYRRVAGNVER